MSSRQNRQVVLKSRPVGIPQSEHFEIVNTPLPELQPGKLRSLRLVSRGRGTP